MTYPDQTIMAGGDVPGNCFQAALAGVLGVSINAVPHFALLGIHHWMSACVAWLEAEHGLIVNTSPDPTLGRVRQLHIINGQSPRGYSHAVIGDTDSGDMVHDPHPSRAGLTFINSRFYFHQKPASGVNAVEAPSGGWQPIETVPKDGREVILREGARVGAACWVTWPGSYNHDGAPHGEGGEGWTVGYDGDLWRSPDAWQAMPPAGVPRLDESKENDRG